MARRGISPKNDRPQELTGYNNRAAIDQKSKSHPELALFLLLILLILPREKDGGSSPSDQNVAHSALEQHAGYSPSSSSERHKDSEFGVCGLPPVE